MMNTTSPVYIVDDDLDDHEIIKEIWQELQIQHPLKFFNSTEEFLKHIKADPVTPVLIISDINMPKMDGFGLRKVLLDDPSLHYKTIPFVFWSTSVNDEQVRKAFDLQAHGIFVKDGSYKDLKNMLTNVVSYWETSKQPQA